MFLQKINQSPISVRYLPYSSTAKKTLRSLLFTDIKTFSSFLFFSKLFLFFNCCCPFGVSSEYFIPSYYFKLYCALVCPVSPVLLLLYNSLFILATSNYCICFPQPLTTVSHFTSIHFLLFQFCSLFYCLCYSD